MAAVFRGEARKMSARAGAMKGIVLYYVIVNIVLFLSMLRDKFCAIRHWRRIPGKMAFAFIFARWWYWRFFRYGFGAT